MKTDSNQSKANALLNELVTMAWELSHLFDNKNKEYYALAIVIDKEWTKRHPYYPAFGNVINGDWNCPDHHFTPRTLRCHFTVDNPPPNKITKCPICSKPMIYDEAE
mgnify:CR=1 FL=1